MSRKFLPLVFAGLLALGIVIGSRMNVSFIPGQTFFVSRSADFNKLNDVINYIKQEYVDTIDEKAVVDGSIEEILRQLDPHSAYIPAEDLMAANEPLEGNFEGIGIEFHIQEDTIMVVSTISGGPSEMVGLQPGDRIVRVDDETVAGTGITNRDVMEKLRGKGGTTVRIDVARRSRKDLLEFRITRGKIPINSLDAAFMVDSITGYLRLSRFAATTHDEFITALEALKEAGLKNLILDLRRNPGGYLDAATRIADEFLDGKKLLVYTQGKARPKTEYRASDNGAFLTGRIVVLIDEGSASASEIVAGALQDWDRATIAGRRSFGKGLVQEQTVFPDGSALRLTIARYYTPTGRSIQTPYDNGFDEYQMEHYNRILRGESVSTDSIHFADTLKYITPGGKVVYGGGGIMPDVFVPIDTSFYSDYFDRVVQGGLISQFAYNYVDRHRARLDKETFEEFDKSFSVTASVFESFTAFAAAHGVPRSEAGIRVSGDVIRTRLKAYIARQLYKSDGFYRVLMADDPGFVVALGLLYKPESAEAAAGQ
jgi:carboxyl-terminal processing protease